MYSNTTGVYNSALGYQGLYSNTTGGNNTATGLQALYANTIGSDNTAIGYLALTKNTTAGQNVAIGSGRFIRSPTTMGELRGTARMWLLVIKRCISIRQPQPVTEPKIPHWGRKHCIPTPQAMPILPAVFGRSTQTPPWLFEHCQRLEHSTPNTTGSGTTAVGLQALLLQHHRYRKYGNRPKRSHIQQWQQ